METLNIYQKLVEIRKEVTFLQKEKDGAQYKYVSSSQVLHAVRAKMDELQIVLIPRITDHKVSESAIEYHDKDGHTTKRTITYFTELTMSMTWVNAENPSEKIDCPWYVQGVDIAGEKGVGKALTYGEKYFILKQFNIPTDTDEPDFTQGQRREPYSPKRESTPTLDELSEIAKESQKNADSVNQITEGQLKMLYAKSAAAGFKPEEKEKLMARVSAFLGYPLKDFNIVRKSDVTRLAQYLDKQKKAS